MGARRPGATWGTRGQATAAHAGPAAGAAGPASVARGDPAARSGESGGRPGAALGAAPFASGKAPPDAPGPTPVGQVPGTCSFSRCPAKYLSDTRDPAPCSALRKGASYTGQSEVLVMKSRRSFRPPLPAPCVPEGHWWLPRATALGPPCPPPGHPPHGHRGAHAGNCLPAPRPRAA